MIRLLSWNMAHRHLWNELEGLGVDVALLQEARRPRGREALEVLPGGTEAWRTEGYAKRDWRTAIARLTEAVSVLPVPTLSMHAATASSDWGVNREGTIAAAAVAVRGTVAFTAVSVYAPWDSFPSRRIWADGSAHHILSDLSFLIASARHRLVVAGDWNLLHGYGENGSSRWAARYQTVFDRAAALGLEFVGPKFPDGRQAEPWPEELPKDSLCVPTYYHARQTPKTASRQLDFVFASTSIAAKVHARAMNAAEEWGSSDHCRVIIAVDV